MPRGGEEGPGAPSIAEVLAVCREGWATAARPEALEGREVCRVYIFHQDVPGFAGSHVLPTRDLPFAEETHWLSIEMLLELRVSGAL